MHVAKKSAALARVETESGPPRWLRPASECTVPMR